MIEELTERIQAAISLYPEDADEFAFRAGEQKSAWRIYPYAPLRRLDLKYKMSSVWFDSMLVIGGKV